MKIINGERASGKTDGLIYTAYATGARIITPTRQMAEFIEKRARERGLNILPPMQFEEYLDGPAKFANRPPILIDEGEKIIKAALETVFRTEVIAVTMSEPQIKTLFPETLKEAEKDRVPGINP